MKNETRTQTLETLAVIWETGRIEEDKITVTLICDGDGERLKPVFILPRQETIEGKHCAFAAQPGMIKLTLERTGPDDTSFVIERITDIKEGVAELKEIGFSTKFLTALKAAEVMSKTDKHFYFILH